MNKQYQELAAKAGIFYYRKGKLQEDTEKLIKLIVQECANINFRHKIGLSSDQDYEVSNTIKRHFGVEE